MTILYKKRWAFLVTALTLAVFLVLYKFIPNVNNFVNSIFFNSLQQGYNLGSNLFKKNNGLNIESLNSENEQLKSQVNKLTQQLADQERSVKESEDLRKLLEVVPDDRYKKVIGYVVGKDVDLANAVIVNLGSKQGVKVGDLAVSGDGVLVGTVLEAEENHSTLLLITDQQVSIPISKIGESEAIGVTSGQFGLSVMVEMIPQTELINDGDVLVTSDAGKNIPGNIVVGTIKRILSEENKLFKEAIIDPAADFNNLKIVAILIQKND